MTLNWRLFGYLPYLKKRAIQEFIIEKITVSTELVQYYIVKFSIFCGYLDVRYAKMGFCVGILGRNGMQPRSQNFEIQISNVVK